MRISNFDYNLPGSLIAQNPTKSRDKSRFLIFDVKKDKLSHQYFSDLVRFIKPGDLIVINNTKVYPVRLIGKKETGGKVEVLILNREDENWRCLVKGRVVKEQKSHF